MNSHAEFRGAARRGFSVIYEKPPGGRISAPPSVRGLKWVQKLSRDEQSKICLKFTFFSLCCPLFIFFELLFFISDLPLLEM